MSTFKVEIVPVRLERHPNADALSVVHCFGYQVVVRTEDWLDRRIGAYIPPDSVVPDTEQFAFLEGHNRIRAKKLRGTWSMGMLVPAPEGAQIGDDVAEQLGITHYDPPLKLNPRHGVRVEPDDTAPEPFGIYPKYDVENMRRYSHLFVPGEPVIATEKIHGASGRWTFQDGEFRVGSRNRWIKDGDSIWWRALRKYPLLMEYLEGCPNLTAYGEVYGWVQDLRYGHKPGEVSLALFDFWVQPSGDGYQPRTGWADKETFIWACETYGLPYVPLLYLGPFDLPVLERYAEGPSQIPGAGHFREGIVVCPRREREDPEVGRVQLKLVSNTYLEKAA